MSEPVLFGRLLGRSVRVRRRRPAVLAEALFDRLAGGGALTVWPGLDRPEAIAPTGDRAVATWLAATFGHGRPRVRGLDPGTWSALRSRAIACPRGKSIVLTAAEQALEKPLPGARVACVSATGSPLGKLLCFVFEAGADAPAIVVKAIPQPGHGGRLRGETALVEQLRERLRHAPEVAAALPLPPLLSAEVEGEGVVVEPVDPLAASTGEAGREAALAWLAAFARETTVREQPWSAFESRPARDAVAYAWRLARPHVLERVLERFDRLQSELAGAVVPVCAVHGDFWTGNLASRDGQLRVYDWEWARAEGDPAFDLWSYELATLRVASMEDPDELLDGLERAQAGVAAGLERRGLEPRLARATVLSVVADVGFRNARWRGRPGGREPDAVAPMVAAERLLGLSG